MPIDFQMRLFLRELQHQCEEAIAAVHALNWHLNSKDSSTSDIINSIDDFVDHAARASLILWPARRFREGAAAVLRSTISIDENHSLKDRDLRHSLQHFDERLQTWVDANPNGSVADHIVGPELMIKGAAHFRRFDPSTKIYYFLGVAYDIQAHVNAVDDVLTKVKAALDTPLL